MASPCYIVITPARNEAAHLGELIASMISQTTQPRRWVLVDDGSSDQTGAIVDGAAARHTWIRTVHRPDRGFRQQGRGVIDAFYEGFQLVCNEPWDFVVKLDADLSFGPGYFESCLARFDREAQLGIGGGTICQPVGGRLVCEWPGDPRFHVRGATKIYRRACWNGIGGLLRAPGWDTIDELKANMLGWRTGTFAELQLEHHRQAGAADGGWKNWVKNGRANYVTGYHPLFMLCKCVRRLARKPYLLGAAGLLYGFVGGYVLRVPRVADRELVRFVRRQQLNALFLKPSMWS